MEINVSHAIRLVDTGFKDRINDNLGNLFNNKDFADCILKVPNSEERIYANRGILAICSEVFKSEFQTQQLLQGNQPEFTFAVPNIYALKSLTQFCYTGRIVLNDETIKPILKGAILLKINELLPLCSAYVSRRLNSSNCLHFLGVVAHFSDPKFQTPVKCFATEHFDEVCETESFGAVDFKVLAEFLRHARDNLGVGSHGKLVAAAKKWCKYDERARAKSMPGLLNLIRHPQPVAGPSKALIAKTEQLAVNLNDVSVKPISQIYQSKAILSSSNQQVVKIEANKVTKSSMTVMKMEMSDPSLPKNIKQIKKTIQRKETKHVMTKSVDHRQSSSQSTPKTAAKANQTTKSNYSDLLNDFSGLEGSDLEKVDNVLGVVEVKPVLPKAVAPKAVTIKPSRLVQPFHIKTAAMEPKVLMEPIDIKLIKSQSKTNRSRMRTTFDFKPPSVLTRINSVVATSSTHRNSIAAVSMLPPQKRVLKIETSTLNKDQNQLPKLVAVVQNSASVEVYGYDLNLQPLSKVPYEKLDVSVTRSLYYTTRLNSNLILFLGRDDEVDEIIEFNVASRRFRPLPMPHGKKGWYDCFEVAEIAGKMYIFGYLKHKACKEFLVQRFDPVTRLWTVIPDTMPSIRFVFCDFTAVSFENSLYVIYKQSMKCIFHKYTPATNQWTVLQPILFDQFTDGNITLLPTKFTLQAFIFTADDIEVFKYTPIKDKWTKVEMDEVQKPIHDVYTFKNNQGSYIFFMPTNSMRKYDEDLEEWVACKELDGIGKKPLADILFLSD